MYTTFSRARDRWNLLKLLQPVEDGLVLFQLTDVFHIRKLVNCPNIVRYYYENPVQATKHGAYKYVVTYVIIRFSMHLSPPSLSVFVGCKPVQVPMYQEYRALTDISLDTFTRKGNSTQACTKC